MSDIQWAWKELRVRTVIALSIGVRIVVFIFAIALGISGGIVMIWQTVEALGGI